MHEPTETNSYLNRPVSERQLREERFNEYREERRQAKKRKKRIKRAKKVAAFGLVTAAGVGLGTASYEVSNKIGHAIEAHLENSQDNAFNRALASELQSAYNGPVQLDGTAENMYKTIVNSSGEHSAIKLHMNGTEKNKETAASKGTPTYFYEDEPVVAATVSTDGQVVDQKSPTAFWQSTQKDGDVILLINKDTLRSERPTTIDIKIGLGAWGLTADGKNKLKANYEAGEVILDVSNGEITSTTVIPHDAGEPPVELQEVPNN